MFTGAATILIAVIGAIAHVRYLLGYSDQEAWSKEAKQVSVWFIWAAVAFFLIGLFSQPKARPSMDSDLDQSIR